MERKHLTEKDLSRFFNKVNKTNTCWIWTASKNEKGYGLFRFNEKTSKAHRVSYIIEYGNIIDNLVIDHLCKNRDCVNPKHLDLVSQAENISRGLSGKINNAQLKKTTCPKGHEYDNVNNQGHRICNKCHVIRQQKYRLSKSAIDNA